MIYGSLLGLTQRNRVFRINRINIYEKTRFLVLSIDSNSHHPCTLMGAICYGLGEYDNGYSWFEEARKRGADIEDIDKEIKRLVKETRNKNRRKEIIEYLLKKDERRYAWAKKYLKN